MSYAQVALALILLFLFASGAGADQLLPPLPSALAKLWEGGDRCGEPTPEQWALTLDLDYRVAAELAGEAKVIPYRFILEDLVAAAEIQIGVRSRPARARVEKTPPTRNASPRTSANIFGFTGHEIDPETGLVYMKGRYYDPIIGRFLSQDPAAGNPVKPPSLHKYLYAHANPTIYIDPDGREVRVLDEEALNLVTQTLPVELQGAVVVGENGLLQREPLNAIESDDPNFLALRELVNATEVTAVQTSSEVAFENQAGETTRYPFEFTSREEMIQLYTSAGASREKAEREITGPNSFLGYFATPRSNDNPYDDASAISLTGEAMVTIAGEAVHAPQVEKVKTTAHELYGHGLPFQRKKPFQHGDVPDSVFEDIHQRTENTYKTNMTGIVGENPNGPGAVVQENERDPKRRQ